ncbi:beta-N-acetylglucosaminidase domain-containing protein [bacterium]|nr:beta-N-acetylglucosaminidase domain-containing protein [candidate division CSSED10-310 bacterium]
MKKEFFSGVIEGFYGHPWSWPERFDLIDYLAEWDLNTYVYAPKFDPYHRLLWDRPHQRDQEEGFRHLIRSGRKNRVDIVYSLSPGLTLDPYNPDDFSRLTAKYVELFKMGIRSFALLMDDIPVENADAAGHADLANRLMSMFHGDVKLFFCPTIYSGWHLKTYPGAQDYLEILGQNLNRDIEVFWTGPTVVSKSISAVDLEQINHTIRRQVVVWDNFFAIDYLPATSLFTGPYLNRTADLVERCNGLMINPSQHFRLSLLTIAAFADYMNPDITTDLHQAWKRKIRETYTENSDVLETILGYFYAPFCSSPEWESRLERINQAMCSEDSDEVCAELTEIRCRIRADVNLMHFGLLWDELFPFVQTLAGDLDCVVRHLRAGSTESNTGITMPFRDSRWSTPIMNMIHRYFSERTPGTEQHRGV